MMFTIPRLPAAMDSLHSRSRVLSATAAAAAAALALSACSGGVVSSSSGADASAEFTFTVATMAAAGSPQAAIEDWYLDTVEERSEGRITFDRMAPEAICKAPEIVDCLRDGRADFGTSVPAYTPQFFPDESVVGIPFIGGSGQAVMQAFYEVHQEHDGAQKLYDENNLEYVAYWPAGRLLFGSKEPIDNVEGLDGKRMRVTGPILQASIEAEGANIVAITAPETYEGVERGVVDAVGFALDGPVNYKLMEVLPYWTDPGSGEYASFAMWYSKDAYGRLPEELRSIVDDVTEELNLGAGMEAFSNVAIEQCQQMLDSSNIKSVSRWSEDASAQWKNALGDTPKQEWVKMATASGLEDAEGYLNRYTEIVNTADSEVASDPVSACIDEFAKR